MNGLGKAGKCNDNDDDDDEEGSKRSSSPQSDRFGEFARKDEAGVAKEYRRDEARGHGVDGVLEDEVESGIDDANNPYKKDHKDKPVDNSATFLKPRS